MKDERKIIDQIDEQMAQLFRQRMAAAEKIALYIYVIQLRTLQRPALQAVRNDTALRTGM